MASAHQRPAFPGTRKRHNTTAGTARIRKYVKTLGRLTALTGAGAGATVFMVRTRALEVGSVNGGGPGEDDHELGTPTKGALRLCKEPSGHAPFGLARSRAGQDQEPGRQTLTRAVHGRNRR